MKISETLHVIDRKQWRRWLKRYHKTKKEIWLIYYKKHSGKPRIPYDDAVEEALCYGWIDSTVKRIDEEKYAQRFTPRRSGSIWSHSNIKRVTKMIAQGKMTKAGMELYRRVKRRSKKSSQGTVVAKRLRMPADLKSALSRNKKAFDNFKKFAPSYRKMYIYYIVDAKKKETRERRIERVVKLAAQNKKSVML